VKQTVVPVLTVQLVVLLVDKILVLQELPVEVPDPLFYDAGQDIISDGSSSYRFGIDVPSTVFWPRISRGACSRSCRASDTRRIVGTAICRA
jgi:hypothetical protein